MLLLVKILVGIKLPVITWCDLKKEIGKKFISWIEVITFGALISSKYLANVGLFFTWWLYNLIANSSNCITFD